jgi:hypothetical protein
MCVVVSALWNSFVYILSDVSILMPEERDTLKFSTINSFKTLVVNTALPNTVKIIGH